MAMDMATTAAATTLAIGNRMLRIIERTIARSGLTMVIDATLKLAFKKLMTAGDYADASLTVVIHASVS